MKVPRDKLVSWLLALHNVVDAEMLKLGFDHATMDLLTTGAASLSLDAELVDFDPDVFPYPPEPEHEPNAPPMQPALEPVTEIAAPAVAAKSVTDGKSDALLPFPGDGPST